MNYVEAKTVACLPQSKQSKCKNMGWGSFWNVDYSDTEWPLTDILKHLKQLWLLLNYIL